MLEDLRFYALIFVVGLAYSLGMQFICGLMGIELSGNDLVFIFAAGAISTAIRWCRDA